MYSSKEILDSQHGHDAKSVTVPKPSPLKLDCTLSGMMFCVLFCVLLCVLLRVLLRGLRGSLRFEFWGSEGLL